MTFHKCVFRLVIIPPIIIIAIQLSWENLIGTSDLFLRDCMKMQNEEKNVNIASIKPVVAQNWRCHLLSVHGDDDGPAGVRDADHQHRLPLLHHLPQAHEADQPQTHRQWPGHQQGNGTVIVVFHIVTDYFLLSLDLNICMNGGMSFSLQDSHSHTQTQTECLQKCLCLFLWN